MKTPADKLYELLPAIHRLRDAERGHPLRALVAILAEQAAIVEEDLRQRYDDHFIETCAEWVVPYIGDLLGTTPLFDQSRVIARSEPLYEDLSGPSFTPAVALRGRADVARTISFRRRKATRPMLEELAWRTTGWAAHVVEMFERLGWSQCVRNHVKEEVLQSPHLKALEPLDRLNGPFDQVQHNADVRRIGQLDGWYNIPNIALFLWRLKSFPLLGSRARRVGGAGDFRYHASVLGQPAPLFSRLRAATDPAATSDELSVGAPIRPHAFFADIREYRSEPIPRSGATAIYGKFGGAVNAAMPDAPDASLVIVRDGTAVPADDIRCMNLSSWTQPPGNEVGVDVLRGRIAFGPTALPAQTVELYYHYGFPANLGGGPYARTAWMFPKERAQRFVVDSRGLISGSVTSIGAALIQWAAAGKPDAIIAVADSSTYAETLSLEPRDGGFLAIEAADMMRPHLLLGAPLTITGSHPTAELTLSGLLIEGSVEVTGELGRLRLLHSTLVPGRALLPDGDAASNDPSLSIAAPATTTALELAFSISGPLVVPETMRNLVVVDSIIDARGGRAIGGPGGAPGPSARLERTTVLGEVSLSALELASEVIFDKKVVVEDRQKGCVRFSAIAAESRTPRRYRCVDAEPAYTTTRYGQPAYAQLHLSCAKEIKTGAEDGSEIGAYCHLKEPQREENLRLRLREYLPFGLEPGIIFVT